MTKNSDASPYVPVSLLLEDIGLSTASLFELQDGTSALDHVGVRDTGIKNRPGQLTALVTVVFEDELALTIPGLSAVSLVFGGNGQESAFNFEADLLEPRSVRLVDASLALRFSADVLKPVRKIDGRFQVDPARKQIDIGVTATITIDGDSLRIDGAEALELEPCMIGDSGVVIEAEGVKLDLSRESSIPEAEAAGLPAAWTGVFIQKAAIHAPPDLGDLLPDDLTFEKCFIGSGGFTGEVKAEWTPALSRSLAGVEFSLKRVDLGFVQSSFSRMQIDGTIKLPFFDELADVTIGLKTGGGLTVKLTSSNGLLKLMKAGVMKIELDSIAFEVDNGVFTTRLSGKLTPLFGADKGLKWPTFDVKDLTIDSKGNVKLPGGWLSLAEQKTLDFHGFKIEISQIGFGKTDDGGKWIGFSGGLKLVDGLKAGASVEGLRITWYQDGRDPKITLNGAGVELTIPDVLHLKGDVSYHEITADDGSLIHRFDGDIKLELETPELKIDGTLVIGSVKGPQGRYNFFAIYADAELPTGIPLASTGLSIYGFAGLLALQMEPDKHAGEAWFSIDHSKSYFHRNQPGMTDLKSKWAPHKGSFALGAGITLGTLADNGYTFNGKFLLGIILPGPIVFIQGAASFLKKKGDKGDEGEFRALAIYDGRAGNVTIGIDAEYKSGKGGEMIEIGGSMEAFYAFHDPLAWHLWIGKDEPRSLRIRALFGRIVEANAYFMLDAHALALGAWYGYNHAWTFGPLGVRLEAWAEGNAKLSFKPTQFHGDLWIHGLVDLEAFGFGLGIALDAKIAADLFKPFHLRGEFSVGIKLPWPLNKKKLGAKVILQWGPRTATPPLPLPLSQAAIESLKSTVVWPLPRGEFLLPNYDDGNGFLAAASGGSQPASKVPLAPLDARLSLTFGRSVNDAAFLGVNLQQGGWEDIGDPVSHAIVAQARYSLAELVLSRGDGSNWIPVAKSPKSGTLPQLFGSWMPASQLPAGASANLGQTKLLLWSKSPYDFTRATGSSWEEWVSDSMPDYPCVPLLPSKETCFGFASMTPGTQLTSPWTHIGPPDVTLSWGFGPATVEMLDRGGASSNPFFALCFPEAAVRRGIQITSSVPGRSFRIVLAPPTAIHQAAKFQFGVGGAGAGRTCADLRAREAGTLVNPWSSDGMRFAVHGADGTLLQQARIERWGASPLGLNAGFVTSIDLPCASPWVELIVTHRPPFRIIAFNAAGAAVATHAPSGTGGITTETIRLDGTGITRVEVHAEGNEKLVHSVCYECAVTTGPTATGYDDDGVPHGTFVPINGTIVVTGPDIPVVVLTSDGPLCIEQICVTPDPDADNLVGRQEIIDHIREELVRWHDEGEVLEPNTAYQLAVRTVVEATAISNDIYPPLAASTQLTEYAYFRTEGPPGLTKLLPPKGVDAATFDSGLDDLVRYVHETDPPTVPPPGEKPILYRPFYRAYDIGVEFNEDYVEQMYRMDRRDLGLYLFDNSNQPVRDAKGRLLVLQSHWGTSETTTLSETDTHWITLLNKATCLPDKLDPQTFPHSSTMASVNPDRVLAPDTLHEARLVPLLLHEDFARPSLGNVVPQSSGWFVEDSGAGGPSQWQIGESGEPASRFAVQQSPIGNSGPDRNGTILLLSDPPQLPTGHPDLPTEWTDYRVSAYVRSDAGGAFGLVVRHTGPGTGYRFALDDGVRRLSKNGLVDPAELVDHFSYQKKRDYLLTVEAIGSTLRAYVDGEPVFDLTDTTYPKGGIGLYVCQGSGVRFADIAVDDLRKDAPVVYRFQLTTSLFANFHHHLHSFQDEVWSATLDADPTVDAQLNFAVAPSFTAPDEKEARAFETLADTVLGAASRQNAKNVEVTRVERSGADPIFLVRSPEPIVPARTELVVSEAARALTARVAPEIVKLTEATLGAAHAADESVTLLLRDATDLTRHRIELQQLPGPLAELTGDPVLWLESFGNDGAIDRFTIVDSGGASQWVIEHGGIVETSGIGGGNEPELPGSHLLAGDDAWTDIRLIADLRADAGGAIGLLLRYADENNYYRLSLGADFRYRRLVKCVEGQMTMLWDDANAYAAGEPFTLTLEAAGSRLTGFVGTTTLFTVDDDAHAAGRVGIYVSDNAGARCERIEVRRPSIEGLASFSDHFADGKLDGWTLLSDASVPLAQAAAWQASGGALRLDSLTNAGAYAAAGDAAWTDVIAQARVHSGGGMIGMVVRAKDLDNHYRFTISHDDGHRRLVKKSGGTVTVLWEDSVAYEPDQTYELTIAAIGNSLSAYVDGIPLFTVTDSDVASGRVALYSSSNQDAWFSDVRVWPGDQEFADWKLRETFEAFVPDRWTLINEAGTAEPAIWTAEGGELRPVPPPIAPPDGGIPPATAAALRRPSRPPDRVHFAIDTQSVSTEIRLSVRTTIDANGAAGIVFGWKDLANHTILWLDAQRSKRRLLRTVTGASRTLWEDDVAVAVNHPYLVTIDHVDGRLAIYLDAVLMFALDLEPATGNAGVALRAGASARFSELRVAEPEWVCWHGFGEEELHPAGTRVRVHGGSNTALPNEAGLVVRSAALPGDRGRVRLPGAGARLRIAGADGRPQHTRTFLPGTELAPLGVRVLRKADGTAFFLVPQTALAGRLHLQFKYYRERQDAGRVMSQAGDRTPETAVIEL
jgi:hypothetical protein